MKKFDTLYKQDSKGNLREWYVEVDGDKYRTVAGIAGGSQVISSWKTAKPKNVGRSNATTGEEQAIAEVEAKYTKKLDGEYHKTKKGSQTGAKFYKPMLADKWENRKDKIEYPVFVQPKLDGIRCIVNKDGMWSRQGKPIISAPHIRAELDDLFVKDPDLVLDGELYNHDYHDDFNKIVSLVKKTKPKAEDLELSKTEVEYHVYDVPSYDGLFEKRCMYYNQLLRSKYASVVPVETLDAYNEEEVDEQFAHFLSENYEGAIVRVNALYEQKRSKGLLKRKDFQDEEYEIVGIEEGTGNWEGYAKRVFFKLPDGRQATATLTGTQEYCAQVLEEADEYIGKQVTVQYFALTPDGVPRFPVAKAIHKDKRW